MAESIVSDLAVRVLEWVGKATVQKLAPYFGGTRKLDELHLTMSLIQARLFDADRRQEGESSDSIKEWLRQLKRVLYQLEDLFEEVDVIVSEQRSKSPTKFISKVVRFLPSKLSRLRLSKLVNQEAKTIMGQLDFLKIQMDTLQLRPLDVAVSQPALNQIATRETYSFTKEDDVVGRNEDRDTIIGLLLNPIYADELLSVISIVGMGGLGKTTLAKLVYNDPRVQHHFQSKYWACISDDVSSFKDLFGKVFHSITGVVGWQKLNVEALQSKLREAVKGKQFLLVLDDMWDEDRNRWIQLRNLLCEGRQGSKVLVTSRSEVVALNMSTIEPYKLQRLPEEESWALFKRFAFREGQEERHPNLTRIGREIVHKCGNVPLAIRTIAGLLYSKDEEEWEKFRDKDILRLDQKENYIMATLKLSYDHLLPEQKQCFVYCSLYPKDYCLEVEELKRCWVAQGFVKSLDDGHSCFMELLRKCFFQKQQQGYYFINQRSKFVDLQTSHYEMHDLMHDLAQSVGGECLIVDKPMEDINVNIRHVRILKDSLLTKEASPWLNATQHVRSLHLPCANRLDPNVICLHFRRLRVLDLVGQDIHSYYPTLPNSIGELKHLRYLKAGVQLLPKGTTRLQNLQILDVAYMLEMPRDFHKLTSLRLLEITWFQGAKLSWGMPELLNIVHLRIHLSSELQCLSCLGRMPLLKRLELGSLDIPEYVEGEGGNGKQDVASSIATAYFPSLEYLCLKSMDKLKRWSIIEHGDHANQQVEQSCQHQGSVFPRLLTLTIGYCPMLVSMPWSMMPILENLEILDCNKLDLCVSENNLRISPWEGLKSLRSLKLGWNSELESLPSGIAGLTTLQTLQLHHLYHLKTLTECIGHLTQLRQLDIVACISLKTLPKSIPNLTALQSLRIKNCPVLARRCMPDEDDWLLIQHIAHLDISHPN